MLDELNKLSKHLIYHIYIGMQYENTVIVFFSFHATLKFPLLLTIDGILGFFIKYNKLPIFKVELTACDQFYVVFGLAVMFFNS